MLSLTKKTGYGLIAMTRLAQLGPGELACARELSELFGAPASLMGNVLKELSAAGYIESVRGAHGGYRLARLPEEITLADIIETVEGPIRMAECLTDAAGNQDECTCQVMARCPIADPVHRVQRRLNDFLRKVTLAEIVEPSLAAARE